MAALAADAADDGTARLDDRRAALGDGRDEVALQPGLVVDELGGGPAGDLAWKMSGYCVAEWLPQMVRFVMSVTVTPAFFASCDSARLWSSRVMAVNGSPARRARATRR